VRRIAFASAVALASAVAGCGGSSSAEQHTLQRFLSRTPQGRTWAKRFPHRPGSVPCTALDPAAERRVPATCSTDVSAAAGDRVIVTFTQSWSHGSRARTWFVFLRADGTVESVKRAGTGG
jgi:hypothetical protein